MFVLGAAIVLAHTGVQLLEWTVKAQIGVPVPDTGAQTNSNPTPIYRCIGAGGGVTVSLGGDGSSVYVFCDEVKP